MNCCDLNKKVRLIKEQTCLRLYEIFSGRQPRQDVKVFPTIREQSPSPSSGCAGDLVVPKLKSRCPNLPSAGREVECDPSTSGPAERRVGHLDFSFGTTKPPAQPEDGDGVSSRIVGKTFAS